MMGEEPKNTDKETINQQKNDGNANKSTKKRPYVFNCTKCGNCCEKREDVPLTFQDLLQWAKSGVLNSVLPYLMFETVKMEDNQSSYLRLVMKNEDKRGCPMFDTENRICNIYHSLPVDCRSFPLGFNGKNYFIRDRECPGIGNGTMTKERLINDRNSAKEDFDAKIQTMTLIPIVYSLFMKKMVRDQEKLLENLPEEKRKRFEDLIKEVKQ